MKIFICGFTGAGKTSLLRSLRGKIPEKYKLLDLDEYILERITQESIAEYIEEYGFESFRALERDCIDKLSDLEHLVLSLGGGALNESSLSLFSDWKGVFLDTSFEVCYERIKDDHMRPIAKKSKSELLELFDQRHKYYSRYQVVENSSNLIQLIENWSESST